MEAARILQLPAIDPGLRRGAFYLLASAARGSPPARAELASLIQRAINSADALASEASGKGAKAKGRQARAAEDWELQHTVFAAARAGSVADGGDDVSRAAIVGVGSPDPVGARHALALASEVSRRDPSGVARELSQAMEDTAQHYETLGLGAPPPPPGPPSKQDKDKAAAADARRPPISLDDPFSRLHVARLCSNVLHSDQASGDLGREGGPFWRMLVLLATRDPSDTVRFGGLAALAGSPPTAPAGLSGPVAGPGANKAANAATQARAREEAVWQQRRGRAWRLLVSQAGSEVTIPGISAGQSGGAMRLFDVLGRLLVLALRKADSPARFSVAADVAASLAESCLASQSTSRHLTSPDVDKVLGVLIQELSTAAEAPLRPALRCGCVEALLYLQAAGYHTPLTAAKLAQAGSGGGAADGAAAASVQDALLAAVLKCARAKPKDAATFLGYAAGIVGIAPSGVDLAKVTGLWDAAAAAGADGRDAALAAAVGAVRNPSPPGVHLRKGAVPAEVARAARAEDGWNAFVSTAAWWLGERANSLSDERVGRVLPPPPEDAADDLDPVRRYCGRNPVLHGVICALQDAALTAPWQLRAAAAQALAKIALRSGEPHRLQCYGVLVACAGAANVDALGLQSVARPALAILDKVYASQAALERLWTEHGDDVEGWPPEVLASAARRSVEVTRLAERHVCSLPKDRYAVLGPRAAAVLAHAEEEEGGGAVWASFLSAGQGANGAATVRNRLSACLVFGFCSWVDEGLRRAFIGFRVLIGLNVTYLVCVIPLNPVIFFVVSYNSPFCTSLPSLLSLSLSPFCRSPPLESCPRPRTAK
jgi:hypothetical protein